MTFLTLSLFAQPDSRVEYGFLFSPALGLSKSFYIYLPAGYDSSSIHYPVVYFLRLHEYEWFNPNLPGRSGTTLKDIADSLISTGQTGKMILVAPSTGSFDGSIPGLVNMLRPDLTTSLGIGSGRFEDYFIQDLIPHIDGAFRTIPDRDHRGIDGFSLGGYSSVMLSFRHPDYFCSVGSYDGSMMWYDLDDPEVPGNSADDLLWVDSGNDSFFGPIFDVPRNINYMLLHNPVNILSEAGRSKLDSLRSIRYHIHMTSPDSAGNFGRNSQLLDSMAAAGISNTFGDPVLAPNAVHDYGFADLHASRSLVKHWETFQQAAAVDKNTTIIPLVDELFQNFPNPFNPETVIPYYLVETTNVELTVYNMLGQKIKTLVRERQHAGSQLIQWHGRDESGARVSSGIYIFRLRTGSINRVRKMVLLR